MSTADINFLLEGQEDINGRVNYDVFIKKLMSDLEDA